MFVRPSANFNWTFYWLLAIITLTYGNGGTHDEDPCENKIRNTELNTSMKTLKSCVGEEPEYKLEPLDCSKLKKIVKCFNAYVESVYGCYQDDLAHWNQTVQNMDKAREYLCSGENSELSEIYRVSGVECLEDENVRNCGSSLLTILLNVKSYQDIVKEILKQNQSYCRNYAEINSCVVDTLKNMNKSNCHDKVAVITERVKEILENDDECHSSNDGNNDSSINSTIIWILAVFVTSLVLLTPS